MAHLLMISVVVSLTVSLYKNIIYQIFISPLRFIPNAHWVSPISQGWILKARKNGSENRALLDCHQRLGPIVRTAPNEVSISRVEDVRTVYSGNFEEAWLAQSFDNYGVKNMFSMENMEPHTERKRMMWQAYSKTNVLSSDAVKGIVAILVSTRLLPNLEQASIDGRPCNAVDLCCSWVTDCVTAYLFGIENGSNMMVQRSVGEDFFDDYRIKGSNAFWQAQFPNLTGYINKASFGHALGTAKAAKRRIEAWCLSMCNASEASYERSSWAKDSLRNVYSHLRMHLERSITTADADRERSAGAASSKLRKAIASEMLDHCAAPQETAGTVLSFCVHQLSLNPSVQTTLRRELQANLPEETKIHPPRDIETFHYLEAVILEALRLHNHAPGPPRITPLEGCTLAGCPIPYRTRVSALAYVLHRNEDVFPDSEVFKPNRWTEASAQERTQMQRHFWPFGSGDRQCIAIHFATTVMKSLVATIYSNFKTTLVEDLDRAQNCKKYLAGPKGTPLFVRFEEPGVDVSL